MAITVVPNLITMDEADLVGTWTSTPTADSDFYREATASLSVKVSNTTLTSKFEAANVKGAFLDDSGTPTVQTTGANNDTTNDVSLLPALGSIGVNDAYYFGGSGPWNRMDVVVGTNGAGTWVITWEYWNGSTYTALSGVSDGSSGWTAGTGARTITWTLPTDWVEKSEQSITAFWARARVSSFTSATTRPLGTRVRIFPLIENNHIYMWAMTNTPKLIDPIAAGGIRIYVEDLSANNGSWYVGGKDFGVPSTWDCYVVNTDRKFDAVSATPPDMTQIRFVGVTFKTTGTINKINCWWDVFRYGDPIRGAGLTLRAGTAGDPGTFSQAEAASNADTDGAAHGILRKEGGVYFARGKLRFGGLTSGNATYFSDTNQILVFEDRYVNPSLYEIILQGNSGANTEVYFGTKSGTSGISGCIFKSVPPKNVLGAVADDGGALTTETAAANNDTANDMTLLPATGALAVNDAYYFGGTNKFNKILLNIGKEGRGAWAIIWEYWNGSAYASLSGVTDNTNAFKVVGKQEISFTSPNNWTTNSVNSITAYWVRGRLTTGDTAPAQRPLGTRCRLVENGVTVTTTDANVTKFGFLGCGFFDIGRISLPDFNSDKEFLNCNVEGCSQVTPGTGILKNSNFISSVAEALELSSTSHNVDNCNFISCSRGVHASAAGSFTFNALKFSGSTFDIKNSNLATNADSYAESNSDNTTTLNSGGITGIGQSFTGNGQVLATARFWLKKTGTPTGNAVAKVYDHSGVFGTSSVPTGAALATSDNFNVATLTTDNLGLYSLHFTGATNQIVLTGATKYVVTIEYSGGDGSNNIQVGYDGSSPGHGGNYSSFSGSWSANSGRDNIFYVYTGGIVTANTSNGSNPGTSINTGFGSTSIVNTVVLKVTAKDESGNPIENAQVGIFRDSDNFQLMNELTLANGSATEDFNYLGVEVNVSVRVRKGTGGNTKYVPVNSPQIIDSNGVTVTITLSEDTINTS